MPLIPPKPRGGTVKADLRGNLRDSSVSSEKLFSHKMGTCISYSAMGGCRCFFFFFFLIKESPPKEELRFMEDL